MGQSQSHLSRAKEQKQSRLRRLQEAKDRKKTSYQAEWQALRDRQTAWNTGDPDIMDAGEANFEDAVRERREAVRAWREMEEEVQRAAYLEKVWEKETQAAGAKKRKRDREGEEDGGEGKGEGGKNRDEPKEE